MFQKNQTTVFHMDYLQVIFSLFSGCFQLFIEIQIEFNAFSINSVYLWCAGYAPVVQTLWERESIRALWSEWAEPRDRPRDE